MATIDASIPLSVQTPTINFAGAAQNALTMQNMQQTQQLNQQKLQLGQLELSAQEKDAQDNATMSNVLRNIDPNDPTYDDKATKALTAAGVSPAKVLAFQKSALDVQNTKTDIALRQAQKLEADQKRVKEFNDMQLDAMHNSSMMIADTTGDVVKTYDALINKDPKGTLAANAAAKSLFQGHVSALLADPTVPDQLKKAITAQAQQIVDPKTGQLNIEKVRELNDQSTGHIAMVNDEKAKREAAKVAQETAEAHARATALIPAQAAEQRALAAEHMAKAAEERAFAGGGEPQQMKDDKAALFERLGPTKTRMSPNKMLKFNNNIATIRAKNPTLSSDELADMVVSKMAATVGQSREASAVGQRLGNIDILEHTVKAAGDQVLETQKLVTRYDSTIANKVLAGVKTAYGNPQEAAYYAAINTYVNEYAKVVSGGNTQLTNAAREHAMDLLSNDQSKPAVEATLSQLAKETNIVKQGGQAAMQDVMHNWGKAITNPEATPAAPEIPAGWSVVEH